MDLKKHDVSALARGENAIQKQPVGPEPASAFGAKYPFNKVTSTKGGHVIEIDDTPGAERIHIYHKSGSYEEINNKGRRVTKTTSDNYDIVVGNNTIYVQGNVTIQCDKDCTVTAKGDVNVNSSKTVTVSGTSNVNVKAKKINLN